MAETVTSVFGGHKRSCPEDMNCDRAEWESRVRHFQWTTGAISGGLHQPARYRPLSAIPPEAVTTTPTVALMMAVPG
jgi:hypothetical protein